MNRTKRITLLIVFTLIFGIIAFFHESRLGKWIDNEVYEFIYASESFITTSILLGATKIGEVWAMVCLSLMLVAYLMLKRYKIEALFFVITMSLSSILNPLLKNIFDRERPTLLRLIFLDLVFLVDMQWVRLHFLEVQCILLSVEHQEVQKASLLDYVRHLFYSFLFQEFI